MEERVTNGILSSAVRASVTKLAEKGIDGCTTKDVILASFGCLSLNGGLCSSNEVKAMTSEVKKFGWKIAGMCFSTLIAIVMVLIFL